MNLIAFCGQRLSLGIDKCWLPRVFSRKNGTTQHDYACSLVLLVEDIDGMKWENLSLKYSY